MTRKSTKKLDKLTYNKTIHYRGNAIKRLKVYKYHWIIVTRPVLEYKNIILNDKNYSILAPKSFYPIEHVHNIFDVKQGNHHFVRYEIINKSNGHRFFINQNPHRTARIKVGKNGNFKLK